MSREIPCRVALPAPLPYETFKEDEGSECFSFHLPKTTFLYKRCPTSFL